MQPPHFLFLGRNIMSTCSAPALGVQLSCCLVVKAFPTVTGSTQDLELGQGSKGGGVNQEALPGTGASTVTYCMPCPCPCSDLTCTASI